MQVNTIPNSEGFMNILLTGSVAYDYLMTFPGHFRDHILPEKLESLSLSFLVDNMVKRRGGVSPNIAYTLALLGVRSRIMATVGEDFAEYREWLESVGVDTSAMKTIPGKFTASYFANTDLSNAQIASFYTGAMAHAAELSLRELDDGNPDLVVISPNDPEAMVKYVQECRELGLPYLYDPSQQIVRLPADDLRAGVEGALSLFVNEYEFELLQKRAEISRDEIIAAVQFVVVTRGEMGAQIYVDDEIYDIEVVPPEEVVDPTGVGDAFRGGFLSGYSHGLDWEMCGKIGALAATYCLETDGPQGFQYTPQEFVARFRDHFDDHGALDILI